jgi:protein SCO1/2
MPLSPQNVLVILLALVSLLTTGLITLHVLRQPQPTDLPTVAAFDLRNQADEPFTRDTLAGKVWVANFIFTRCPGMCPAMTSQMYLLQERLRHSPRWDDIRLVSFTVDPRHDTPQVLAEYARISHAIPGRWHFVTGEAERVYHLIRNSFLLVAEEAQDPDAPEPIIHSSRFVLVDAAGRIRGYYDFLDEEERAQMIHDLEKLMGTTFPPPQ